MKNFKRFLPVYINTVPFTIGTYTASSCRKFENNYPELQIVVQKEQNMHVFSGVLLHIQWLFSMRLEQENGCFLPETIPERPIKQK